MLIAVFLIVLYFTIWQYEPTVDDIHRPKDRRWPNTQRGWFIFFRGSTSYNPPKQVEHLIGVLLHGVVVYLVYLRFGLTTATLVCVHPCAVQIHTWFNGRRYGVSAIIAYLVTLYPWAALLWPWTAVWQFSGLPSILLSPMPVWGWVVGAALLPFTFRFAKKWFKSRQDEVDTNNPLRRWDNRRPVYSLKLFGRYFWRTLFPTKVAYFYPWYDYLGVSKKDTDDVYRWDKDAWAGLLAVGVCIAAAYYGGTYGILWFCLFIAPFLHIRTQFVMAYADRYSYIASAGLLSLIPAPWSYVAIGWYAATTLYAVRQYRDFRYFYDYNCAIHPYDTRSFIHYCGSLAVNKKYTEAIAIGVIGLHYRPQDYALNMLLGKVYKECKNYAMARRHFDRAMNNPMTGKEAQQIADIIKLKESMR